MNEFFFLVRKVFLLESGVDNVLLQIVGAMITIVAGIAIWIIKTLRGLEMKVKALMSVIFGNEDIADPVVKGGLSHALDEMRRDIKDVKAMTQKNGGKHESS